jgi:hypothetical protein
LWLSHASEGGERWVCSSVAMFMEILSIVASLIHVISPVFEP